LSPKSFFAPAASNVAEAVRRQFRSKIARSATWILHGQGFQLAAQFAYFVLIAHVLGPKGYGTFVACTAVVLAVAPFSPIGAGQVLVKYVSRNRETLPVYFGNALLITLVSGSLWCFLLLMLRGFLLPPSVNPGLLICVGLADLICTQTTATCGLAYLAIDEARKSANALVLAAMLRLGASLILLTSVASPDRWAQYYLGAAAIAAGYQCFAVARISGLPRIDTRILWRSLREGFHFATSTTAQTVYDNIDKSMLARLSTVEAAAIYAVAYRFIDASMLPIRALASSTYPEFFRQGERGIFGTYSFAKRILRRSVLYGLFSTVVLYLAAGAVPVIMGKGYAASSAALRLLCPLILIKSVHAFLTDTLTGANYQAERSAIQIGIALFNVLINLWLIRAFSWRGASWSSILTDFLLMASLHAAIRWHFRRDRRTADRNAAALTGNVDLQLAAAAGIRNSEPTA
jgi:O-antigen/teichoic acid export membrane protein